MISEYSCGSIPFFQGLYGYRFLIIQHQEGHWGFPKGHTEEGETPEQTATREFQEETGIKNVQIIGPSLHQEYVYPDVHKGMIHKHVTYFLGEIQEADCKDIHVQKSEIQQYMIGSFQEVREKLTDPRVDRSQTMPPLLREVEKRLKI